jgi:hypothetical protein
LVGAEGFEPPTFWSVEELSSDGENARISVNTGLAAI